MAIDYRNIEQDWLRDFVEGKYSSESALKPLLPTDQSVVLGQTPPKRPLTHYGDPELGLLANQDKSSGTSSFSLNSFINSIKGLFRSLGPSDKDDAKESVSAGKGLAPAPVSLPGRAAAAAARASRRAEGLSYYTGPTYTLKGKDGKALVSYYRDSDDKWTAVNEKTGSIMPGVAPAEGPFVYTGLEPSDGLLGRIGDWFSDLDPLSMDKGEVDTSLPFSSTFERRGLSLGPVGLQGLMDPSMSTRDKYGAAGHLISSIVGGAIIPFAGPLGILGSVLNAAGAYHKYNPSLDSNLSYNPYSGRISWDSLSAGARGHSYGAKSNYNMMKDLDPSQMVPITDREGKRVGFAPAGKVVEEMKQQDVFAKLKDDAMTIFPMTMLDEFITTETPFEYKAFDLKPDGTTSSTNRQALQRYNLDGTGPIRNTAAFLAGKGAGYEGTSRIADEIAGNLAAARGLTGWEYSPGSGTAGKGNVEGGGLGGWADWTGTTPDGEEFDWSGAMYDSWGEDDFASDESFGMDYD